jgi:hypothetical protein
VLAIVLVSGAGCKDRTATDKATETPPTPTSTAQLSLTINNKPLRVLDNAELAKLTPIKPPPGASAAYRLADLLSAQKIEKYKHVAVISEGTKPTNIGASLIDDPTTRPALAIYPDGSVSVFTKAGPMADTDGFLTKVTALNVASTSANLPDGDGNISGSSAFEIVGVDGKSKVVNNDQITALAKGSIPRKDRVVPAVPIEDLLAKHSIAPGTSIEFVGRQRTVSLPWPAAKTFLYASRQGALHMWRTAESDNEGGMDGVKVGRVYELRNVQAIRVLQ